MQNRKIWLILGRLMAVVTISVLSFIPPKNRRLSPRGRSKAAGTQ